MADSGGPKQPESSPLDYPMTINYQIWEEQAIVDSALFQALHEKSKNVATLLEEASVDLDMEGVSGIPVHVLRLKQEALSLKRSLDFVRNMILLREGEIDTTNLEQVYRMLPGYIEWLANGETFLYPIKDASLINLRDYAYAEQNRLLHFNKELRRLGLRTDFGVNFSQYFRESTILCQSLSRIPEIFLST